MTNEKDEIEIVTDEEEESLPALPDLQKKIKKLKDDLKNCEEEKKEYLEGWQRAKADYINYRKDEQKRFVEMMQFATAGLILEVLPVLDSFAALENIFKGELRLSEDERGSALKHIPKETEQGILLIRIQLEDILKKQGLEQMKVGVGENFNPELHESIGEIESDMNEGKVAEVVQKGYLFQGKVLRPARVKIAKGN